MSVSVIAPGMALIAGKGELSEELAPRPARSISGIPGGGKNADVPDTPVGNVGQSLEAEPGQAHLDGGEAQHVFGCVVARRNTVAPLMSCPVRCTGPALSSSIKRCRSSAELLLS